MAQGKDEMSDAMIDQMLAEDAARDPSAAAEQAYYARKPAPASPSTSPLTAYYWDEGTQTITPFAGDYKAAHGMIVLPVTDARDTPRALMMLRGMTTTKEARDTMTQGTCLLPKGEEIYLSAPLVERNAHASVTMDRSPDENIQAGLTQWFEAWETRRIKRREERDEWGKRFRDDQSSVPQKLTAYYWDEQTKTVQSFTGDYKAARRMVVLPVADVNDVPHALAALKEITTAKDANHTLAVCLLPKSAEIYQTEEQAQENAKAGITIQNLPHEDIEAGLKQWFETWEADRADALEHMHKFMADGRSDIAAAPATQNVDITDAQVAPLDPAAKEVKR